MAAADFDRPTTLSAAFVGATANFAVSEFWATFMVLTLGPERRKKERRDAQLVNAWVYEHELSAGKGHCGCGGQGREVREVCWVGVGSEGA